MMKRMRIIVVVILLLGIAFLGIQDYFLPSIRVRYNNQVIDVHETNHEGSFQSFMTDNISHVFLEDSLDIIMDDSSIQEIYVHDYILNDEGEIRFTIFDKESTTLTQSNQGYKLQIHANETIYLSSLVEENIYRGIEITLVGKHETKSFLFIIQTKAY